MTINPLEDTFTFSSGKELYGNNCILGLSPELKVYTGYDDSWEFQPLTLEEKLELADYAIQLWERFKLKVVGDS